jgi:hypothetical protein
MTGHSCHYRKDDNSLFINVTMVNPSNILAAMFPFDDNKQTIVTPTVGFGNFGVTQFGRRASDDL